MWSGASVERDEDQSCPWPGRPSSFPRRHCLYRTRGERQFNSTAPRWGAIVAPCCLAGHEFALSESSLEPIPVCSSAQLRKHGHEAEADTNHEKELTR